MRSGPILRWLASIDKILITLERFIPWPHRHSRPLHAFVRLKWDSDWKISCVFFIISIQASGITIKMAAPTPEKPEQNVSANIPWLIWAVLAVAVILLAIFNQWVGDLVLPWCGGVRKFCHNAPFLVGAIVLLVMWLLYAVLGHNPNPFETVRGVDKRWSTSKLQFFCWTVVAIFSYASVYAALIGVGALAKISEHGVGSSVSVPANLLLAMGLSVTTALAAKGITVSQLNNQATAKEHVAKDDAELGDLVKDDGGAIDLTKVQMLGWTVIALGAFFSQVVNTVVGIGFGSAAQAAVTLPDIDTSLMVLMGLGQGAYLAKKIITTNTPAISSAKPALDAGGRPGTDVTLKGSAFGMAQADSVITYNGLIAGFPVTSWRDTEIIFTLADGALDLSPGQKYVGVIVQSQKSNTVPINVLRTPPTNMNLVPSAGNTQFALNGQGFGTRTNADLIKLNDDDAKPSLWTDAVITFPNPAPAKFTRGTNVKARLFLDGERDKPTVESAEITLP